MTLSATTGSFLFNFTTNGNNEILFSKLGDELRDPAVIGTLLAAIYFIASFSQLIIGHLIDRVPLKNSTAELFFSSCWLLLLPRSWMVGAFILRSLFLCALFSRLFRLQMP